MAQHTDHNGNPLTKEEGEIYWRGFILGKESMKPKKITKFIDETGFEKYLLAIGWVLVDLDYRSDYFTSYGTVARTYRSMDKSISIGLVGVKTQIGIYLPFVSNSNLPLPGEYEVRLWEILNDIQKITPIEMLNDI